MLLCELIMYCHTADKMFACVCVVTVVHLSVHTYDCMCNLVWACSYVGIMWACIPAVRNAMIYSRASACGRAAIRFGACSM